MPMKDAQLCGQIANAEIAEVCLDRQPPERIFGQWYLDDLIDAPILQPKRTRTTLRSRNCHPPKNSVPREIVQNLNERDACKI
jgi:hypothetical protein